MVFVIISHCVNVLVAGVMAFLLMINQRDMQSVFGPVTPARQILSSLYMAIAITSFIALILPTYAVAIALILFPLQILYKISTLFTVSSKSNPVIWWNLGISVLHMLSLYMISTQS